MSISRMYLAFLSRPFIRTLNGGNILLRKETHAGSQHAAIQPKHNCTLSCNIWANLTKEALREKRGARTGRNIAIVRQSSPKLHTVRRQQRTKTQCVCVCVSVRVSKPSTTKLRNIFMTTPPHVPAFWSDSLFIKPRSSAASTECSLGDKTWSKLLPHFPQNIPDMCCGHGGSRWQIFQDKRELYSITGSSPTNVDVGIVI